MNFDQPVLVQSEFDVWMVFQKESPRVSQKPTKANPVSKFELFLEAIFSEELIHPLQSYLARLLYLSASSIVSQHTLIPDLV
jgi:hypothetical protein